MNERFDIAHLASILSLELDDTADGLVLSRHGLRVALPGAIAESLDADSVEGRHLAYGVLLGVRLAIDRTASGFDVADERPQTPARVFHHHEIPSVYGDRLPRLVPTLVLRWFEALTGLEPVTTAWHIDGLRFVYILETGKHLHVLAESDMDRLAMTRDRLISDARHALFYNSYRLKARDKERTDQGRVRTFRTVEGLSASRAMLLPDFDYDAAREHGCFSIPSRDTMIIGRPEESTFSETICDRVCELTAELVESEAFPLCSMVYRMTANEVRAGDFVGGHTLPLSGADIEAVLPPESSRLERTNQAQ